MRFKCLILLFLVGLSEITLAQSTVIGPGTVLPQMTSAQRTALSNPVNGMLVFDTSTNSYWFMQNTNWVELPKGGSTSNYWEINGLEGNELKNTNSGGLWSANPTVVDLSADDVSNPPTAPVNGDGTRLMWIPSRSAFRVGTVADDYKSWDADSIGLFSFASGYNTKASGFNSSAFGAYSQATGFRSSSFGVYTKASGNVSMAFGAKTIASGSFSFSIGEETLASGNHSISGGYRTHSAGSHTIAFGDSAVSSGTASVAMGNRSRATGESSVALGKETSAFGQASFAVGWGSKALNSRATAMGNQSMASGQISFALGNTVHSKAYSAMAIGSYNDISDSPDLFNISSTDRLFQIGNGSSDEVRSNAMTVLRNGYIGTYNVTDPQANLHLQYASTDNWDAHLRLQFSPTEYGNIVYDAAGLKFRNWGIGDNFYFRNRNNTSVTTIFENGNMTIAGTLTQNSDQRLKKDLVKITNSSKKLEGLQAYNYHWKAAERDKSLQTGLLAQEVQKHFPELVIEDEDGFLSVNYLGLIPHIIQAQQELRKQNNALERRLAEIEKMLQEEQSDLVTSRTK
ncbi:tail fiber domain-containing protein [Jiulongibacter sp. NS-SX5]|uniref:tail fiber domain-containing protein n=1 Tax=Jiulongibacter sp. NS-SX5 TaxID=3463854 RepID=UPI00405866FE